MTQQEGSRRPIDLLNVNPSMSAEEAVQNIRLYYAAQTEMGGNQMIEAREGLLMNNDQNPEDWTFYSNVIPHGKDGEWTDQDMQTLRKNFPHRVEFLVLKGAYIGGVLLEESSGGIALPTFSPDHYSAFIRVQPPEEANP